LRFDEMGEETAGVTAAELKKCNLFAIRKWEVVCFVVDAGNSNRGFAIRNFDGMWVRVKFGFGARDGDLGRVWVVAAAL
jgi:hypothetical protein